MLNKCFKMNAKLFTVLLYFLISSFERTSASKDNHNEFNRALAEHINKLPASDFSKSESAFTHPGTPIMRRSSAKAKYLHDLYTFAQDYTQNENRRRKRQDNPQTLSETPGYVIGPNICPFTKLIKCNASYIYRYSFKKYYKSCKKCSLSFASRTVEPYIVNICNVVST